MVRLEDDLPFASFAHGLPQGGEKPFAQAAEAGQARATNRASGSLSLIITASLSILDKIKFADARRADRQNGS
jgi:hypothetical protein